MAELKKATVLLNGVEITNYRDGIPIKYTSNEELDSGILIVPALPAKLSIKRKDQITLYYKDGNSTKTKYFLVAGFNWEQETQNWAQTYTYTISLVSITVKLQDDLLPNISITQPLNNKRTIYDEIVRLNKILGSKYSFSSFLRQKTENVTCPEFQWNKRNFWEILNDLLAVVDCIVTMTNSTTISCIQYTSTGSSIPTTKIINIKYFEDANEYCTELEMNAENVVGDNVTSISQKWITPRSSEYALTTDNAQVILEKPIYYIEKVLLRTTLAKKVTIEYSYTEEISPSSTQHTDTFEFQEGYLFEKDITQWVVEDEVYKTKLPSNSLVTPFTDEAFNYKRMFLSYQEGSNIIDNLGYNDKTWFPSLNSYPAINNIIRWELFNYFKTVLAPEIVITQNRYNVIPFGYSDYSGESYQDIRDLFFNVSFTSLNSIRFRTTKQNSSSMNPKILASNQGASYVDAEALGLSEQANANRIGNPYYELTLRDYVPTDNCYYYSDGSYYHLAQYELQLNNIGDYFCKAVFIKDFVRKNLFTGINSKARYTSIAKGSEALLRQDIYNINLSMTSTAPSQVKYYTLISYLWYNLGKKERLVALVKTDSRVDYFYLTTSCYLLGNNRIIIEFRFQDNVSAGIQVSSTDTNAYICQGCKYVDDNGEFDDISFEIMPMPISESDIQTRGRKYPIAYKNGSAIASFPDSTNVIAIEDVLKDNREIYGMCVNLDIKSAGLITIYDKFYKLLPMVNQEATDIYVYVSTEEQEMRYTELIHLNGNNEQYVINYGVYIEFDIENFCLDKGIIIDDVAAWGLCTDNDEKIIESSDVSSSGRKIYINNI